MTQQQENNRKLLHDRGICVIIPTYNNAGTIERVVRKTCEYCDDVIVVNDGSTDDTEKILKGIGNVEIVGYEKNKGKGYALKMGFRRARKMGFAYAITLDADGQHFSEDIPLFLQANQKHPGCLIVGSRNMEGVERSKGSIFANKFSDFWFWVQTGRWLSDTQTGYRLYPLKKHYGLPVLSNRYEAELQLMVFASWHGVKLEEIPVNVYYPPKEERVSHFRPGIDFARISLLRQDLEPALCLDNQARSLESLVREAGILIADPDFKGYITAWAFDNVGNKSEIVTTQRIVFESKDKHNSTSDVNIILPETEYRDIDGLLAACDILITDYTDLGFAYSLLDRPMIHYWFDANDYLLRKKPGRRLTEYAWGQQVFSEEELIDALKNPQIDPDDRAAFRSRFMEKCDGHSAERIVNRIAAKW